MCLTKSRERPGRTKACVTSRDSPLSTNRLQPLHLALPVGASPSENECVRVLKWYGFMLAGLLGMPAATYMPNQSESASAGAGG